ncbi:MAG: 6-carboxytetrahydropterin synthase [Planctomycetota bacterium]|jgi:6-pyruvoyltetrahydropterin/6-carboxytetrahydropterin synthase|nr:6-carboxytetrahydropterin synthase [Planctomycetota bacterium]
MLYRVTKVIDFCYGHRLLNYSGKCRHLHGHNGRLEIDLDSNALDELGMVMDFGDVKAVVKRWIDENLDHRMILHRDDPAVEFLKQQNEPMFLIDTNPTAESIAALILNFARDQGLPVSEVRLWETASSYASCRE